MSIHAWRAAAVFGCGLACGVAFAPTRGASHLPPAETCLEAEPVRGVDSGQGAEGLASAAFGTPPAKAATPIPAPPAEPGKPPHRSEVARRALDATVYIRGGSDVYGAGILLDDQGHILTCRHVVDGLEGIRVFFADGSEHTAKVLDSDARLDAALLQLDFPRPSRVQVAGIASVELGDALLAMGAPRKMAFSLGRGMATYVGRSFDGVHYLQTDLALNGGSSGGPVLDRFGRVVAMSSFVLKDTEGLAFALPVDYALERFAMWLDSASATTLKLDAKAFARWQADVQARGIRKHVAAGSSGLATADETVSP